VTILVPLTLAAQTTKYDEIALFNKVLSASQFADHYAGSFVSIQTDPQDALGWEEVYGSDYPLTSGDVPVLSNGLCRVRYVPATFSFAIDAYNPGVGWQEQGRVTTWFDDSGTGATYTQQGGLQSAELQEWTQERGVVQVTTAIVIGSTSYRMETYVTLQRGWTGPRFEIYPSPRGGVKLGTRILFSPYQTGLGPFNPPGGFATDPWTVALGGSKTVVATWTRAVDTPSFITDGVAYGTSRSAIAISAAQNTTGVGYGSMRLGFGPRGLYAEAEPFISASGTASVQSDGTANNGQSVRDTQTAQTAQTLALTAAQLSRYPLGKYQVWARVRVGTSGDTVSVTAGFAGTGATTTGPTTSTSTTYVWLYVGEATKGDAANTGFVTIWRSAGAGVAGQFIDQVALVPVEMRVAAAPTYDGARDLALENLYDSRATPELVAR
jgi:hypothetical protein